MVSINEITAAAYRLLKADAALGGMCMIYRGAKRPVSARSPAVTVDACHLERGEGEGMWICSVVVTAYVRVLPDGEPDYGRMEDIDARIYTILCDADLQLTGAKTITIFYGGTSGITWDPVHSREVFQESTFGVMIHSVS